MENFTKYDKRVVPNKCVGGKFFKNQINVIEAIVNIGGSFELISECDYPLVQRFYTKNDIFLANFLHVNLGYLLQINMLVRNFCEI